MTIIRLDQRCSPLAMKAIATLPESNLHHCEYELRHPLGIYTNAIREICLAFNASLTALSTLEEEYNIDRKNSTFKSILKIHKDLLYRLREFIDDCYLVLQGISPVNGKYYPKTIFSNQYLSKIKFPGFKSFERKIAFYKNNYVGAIVNSIKHKHRKLRGIYFYGKDNAQIFIPGYYVEGVSKKGRLAPCRSVHQDENSAFSFNRDIKLHIWYFFLIDEALSDAINAAKTTWNIRENAQTENIEQFDLSNLLEKISALPHQFYDDEQLKPTVRIEQNDRGYELEYPYKKGIRALPENMGIISMPIVDMTVPSIALPYFKR